MRFLLLAAIPMVLQAQGGAPVEGTVISSVTHQGLAGVAVTVQSTGARRVSYTAATGADGSFRIGSIDLDGEYRAVFEKSGYRAPAKDHRFSLAAATGAVRLDIVLTPLPQLRGRVLDSEGHPAANARVDLVSSTGNWVFAATTAKDGAFVFQTALPAPTFVLLASPDKDLPPPESPAGEKRVWAPTYYPGGTERSQATTIVWRADSDMVGYEIRLRSTPVYRVRGTVTDETGKPVEGAGVKLAPADGGVPVVLSLQQPEAKTVSGPEGAFELSSVRPGDWLLAADWKRGNQLLSATVNGRLSRGDWEGVRIRLQAPFSVKGRVEASEGGRESRGRPLGTVVLMPLEQSGVIQIAVGSSGADGRFEIPNVLPGRYRIVATGMEGRYYADSVQLGGREVLGQAVDITDGSLPIHVLYKDNGGAMQGAVEQCALVVLFPKDPSMRDGQLNRSARCGAGGRFEIHALRPGDYYAAAVAPPRNETVEQVLDEMLFDPSLAASDQFTANVQNVRVEGGQSTLVSLKLTPWPEQ